MLSDVHPIANADLFAVGGTRIELERENLKGDLAMHFEGKRLVPLPTLVGA